nr:EAL domain-containing protein [Oceanospirillum sediminis]
MILVVALLVLILLERRARSEDDNRLLSAAIRSAANAVFITDKEGHIHWVNDAFLRLTGYEVHEVYQQNPRILNSGQHSKAFFARLWQQVLNGDSWRGELVNRHKQGHALIVEQTITPIRNAGGDIEHFVAVHEDVTARKQAEQRALYLAEHDPLTGLPNRRYFEQKIYDCFMSEQVQPLAIMFIDLDRFKEINDTMGHEAGDDLLTSTTDKLTEILQEDYLLARLGGDEFAVLVTGRISHSRLSVLAQQIIDTVARPFVYKDASFSVTCSLGIAEGTTRRLDASQMLRQADMAMYRAKHEGKNTYRFFDESMDTLMQRRVFLQQQLEQAVQSDKELSLRYQPQVCAQTGLVTGAEVLLRWETESGEWISPAEFIGLAEETGLIMEVSNWLMESMFRQMAAWNRKKLPFGCISMNVSAVQLAREDLAAHLSELMQRFRIPVNQISVEITETTLMADSELVSDNLKKLKQAGLTLAIDDFGTGYSSLSYLKAIDADYLKIDRSFVIGIGENASDERIVEATIALAHSLKLRVVAEGVDSEHQLEFLREAGCETIQGYLFARPLTAEEFECYVEDKNMQSYSLLPETLD